MSRNSAGTYTAPSNSWNPAVEGTDIDEGDWNTTLDDIESALTDSLDRTGKGKVTGHIDFDENGSPGTPDANVGRLYGGDDSGLTTLYWKDSSSNVYNLLQGAASGLTYQFNSTTTTNSDPGSGKIALNNATLASATEMAISTTTAGGADVTDFIAVWDDSGTSNRGYVYIQKRTNAGIIRIYQISGANTDASGYKRITLTYVGGAGALSNNDPIVVAFGSPGAAGATGAAGPNVGLDYTFSTATSGDPGSGKVLVNNATIASVTQLNISETNRQSASQSATLATWDDSTSTVKGTVRIIDVANPGTNWIEVAISGSITDAGSYDTFPVTYIAHAGTIANNTTVSVVFFRTGDKGADGAGTGDVSGPSSSVDSEIALFSSTTGKVIKRASTTGILKGASGVLSAATAGTDYLAPPSGSEILKANSGGALANATAGTDYMHPGTTSTLTKGFPVTPYNAGTKSSGTYTPAASDGNYQYATNGGAHTLAAPASDCGIDILYTNNGSAGSITFSGFTVGSSTGSALTTTNGHMFIISIRRVNSVATYSVYALQ